VFCMSTVTPCYGLRLLPQAFDWSTLRPLMPRDTLEYTRISVLALPFELSSVRSLFACMAAFASSRAASPEQFPVHFASDSVGLNKTYVAHSKASCSVPQSPSGHC
jgi:hypothetical protein